MYCLNIIELLILIAAIVLGMGPEEEWYNKSLSALRMNTTHHPNLAAPMLQYQT